LKKCSSENALSEVPPHNAVIDSEQAYITTWDMEEAEFSGSDGHSVTVETIFTLR